MPVERRPAHTAPRMRTVSDPALFAALDLTLPGLEAVRAAAGHGEFQAAYAAWAEYLGSRAERVLLSDPRYGQLIPADQIDGAQRALAERAAALLASHGPHSHEAEPDPEVTAAETDIICDFYRLCKADISDPGLHGRLLNAILSAGLRLEACRAEAGAVTLVRMGTAFPEFAAAPRWVETGLRVLAEFVENGLHADGGARGRSFAAAAVVYRHLCAVTDLVAAAGSLPQNVHLNPDKGLLAVIHSGAIRMLDAFLALVPPNGCAAGDVDGREGRSLDLLAAGAIRFKQGEYAWPVAQLGRPLPAGVGVPIPPAFTSVNLPDSRLAAMRSDWAPRAHCLAVDYGPFRQHSPRFVLHAFGETMAIDCGMGTADDSSAAERSDAAAAAWTTGLFLDGLACARNILFVKPIGDLPGYWLVTETATEAGPGRQFSWYLRSPLPLQGNGGLVTATAGDGRSGLQVIPSRPMDLRLGHGESHWLAFDGPLEAGRTCELAVLLAPYERIAPAPGSFQIQTFDGAAGQRSRAYRILHHLGYDLLVVGDGTPAQFDELELATDARFLLIRVRGGIIAALQASRCSQLLFRGEELSQ